MRDDTYAIYQGKEYSASYGKDDTMCLHSYDGSDTANGFVLCEKDHYIKEVPRSALDKLYEIRTRTNYLQVKCGILRQEGERLLLYPLGGDGLLYSKLGFEQVNKGEYLIWVNRKDVEEMWEEKEERQL